MADLSGTISYLEPWAAQISTVGGVFAALCGFFALFAAGAMCKFSAVLQIITGILVVAVEAPSFLPQLAFAAPLSVVFDTKPPWVKVAFYALLTLLPMFTGCFKATVLGFLASAIVTAIHALLVFGKKPTHDEFGVQTGMQQPGNGAQQADQPFPAMNP